MADNMVDPSRAWRRYLAIVAGTLMASAIPILWGFSSTGTLNNFSLPLKGDKAWYRDFAGRSVPEIQEPDIFFHNIGPSITEARKADIILLGPSFMLYALDPSLLREFGDRHRIKIYNMAFFGIRSGEFSRRVIQAWNLHPKLWVVNADDQFEHFFNSAPTVWALGGNSPIPVPTLRYTRIQGWIAVARRNLRWRWEDYQAQRRTIGPLQDSGVYRRYDDGGVYLDNNPRFQADNNPVIKVVRDQACHTTEAIIAEGRRYLSDIGGQSVLTLVPHNSYCLQQAKELGEILGVEALLPPGTEYTSVDGGGHLDHKGAVAFTQQFLSSLEKSEAFKKISEH
jgi:hypothetical protein